MSNTESLFSELRVKLNDALQWYEVPKALGLLWLLRLRDELLEKNLFDTKIPPLRRIPIPVPRRRRK